MKRSTLCLIALVLCWCAFTSTSNLRAQSPQTVQKLEKLAKELKLKPQQKAQLAPILEAEAPKAEAIKSSPSLN